MVIYKWEKAHEIHLTHMQAIILNHESHHIRLWAMQQQKKSGTPFSGPGLELSVY